APQTAPVRLPAAPIHPRGEAASDYHTDFESYDVNLDLRETLAGQTAKKDEDPQELTLPQLGAAIERQEIAGTLRPAMLVELHRKFAIPFACVVFGVVGVPLGVAPGRAVRSR